MRSGFDLLFLLDRHPQPEGTRKYQVATVEFRKQFNTFSCHFHTDSETVIDVSLEHFNMVVGITPRFCRR